ncbi:MAG: UDP-N-acetylmuramate--L-alanine ligase [Candidatus Aenigmatarchaeota archaeon]
MEKVLSGIKNIHLIGIGGIGMTGLALLLKEKGFKIRGSDIQESFNTHLLKDEGIEVFIGHSKDNLSLDVDLVSYSSAIKADNPELIEAKQRNLIVLKRGELLGLLSWDKKTIAVSGSHGKTTTTSMLGYLLTSLGYLPTVFIGGMPLNYRKNAWWGRDYFVIETDESDGSFLYYNPWISVITNIDYEHLDYYREIENLRKSFLKFAHQTKELVIGCGDDPNVKEILKIVDGLSYGFLEENKFRAQGYYFDGNYTNFDLLIEGKFIRKVKIPLLGEHNVLNTLGVLSVLFSMGVDLNKAIEILKEFKGTKRRFQIKSRIGNIIFVDDYAHHPTEIKAVLKAAKNLKPKRIFVIFQPHRFSRVKLLYKEFVESFSYADELVITDIYSASEEKIEGISAEFLFNEIKKNFSGKVRYIQKENLAKEVVNYLEDGDLVLGLGAGDINILMGKIIDEFKRVRVKI